MIQSLQSQKRGLDIHGLGPFELVPVDQEVPVIHKPPMHEQSFPVDGGGPLIADPEGDCNNSHS